MQGFGPSSEIRSDKFLHCQGTSAADSLGWDSQVSPHLPKVGIAATWVGPKNFLCLIFGRGLACTPSRFLNPKFSCSYILFSSCKSVRAKKSKKHIKSSIDYPSNFKETHLSTCERRAPKVLCNSLMAKTHRTCECHCGYSPKTPGQDLCRVAFRIF